MKNRTNLKTAIALFLSFVVFAVPFLTVYPALALDSNDAAIQNEIDRDEAVIQSDIDTVVEQAVDNINETIEEDTNVVSINEEPEKVEGVQDNDTQEEESTSDKVTEETVTEFRTKNKSADGKTYRIEVTLDERDAVSGDANLEVSEIEEGTAEYDNYLVYASEVMMLESADDIAEAHFFDIKIFNNGNKYEPEYPAKVKIACNDAIEVSDDQKLSIVHFADTGAEVIEEVSLSNDGTEVAYEQTGFSVTATVVTNEDNLVNGQQYVLYVQSGDEYYAISHFSEGRDNDVVDSVKMDSGSITNGGQIRAADADDNIIWTVTNAGNGYWTFSYTENGETYYLRDFGGLLTGPDSLYTDSGYRSSTRYQWDYHSDRRLTVRENTERFIRFNSTTKQFGDRSNKNAGDQAAIYFALVTDWEDVPERTPVIHYVDESGNPLTVVNGRDWSEDSTTSPAYLIYDIDNYEYVKTALGSVNGTQIRPLLRMRDQWQYTTSTNQSGSLTWENIPAGEDVYVVYKTANEPVNGGTPKIKESGSTENPVDPKIHKSSVSNGDGTNKLSLSITADTSPLEVEKLADVIVIVDVSSSMRRHMGTSTTTYENNSTLVKNYTDHDTRMWIAADAVNSLADTLIGDNTAFKDSAGNKLIRMSLISFSDVAALEQEFTDEIADYKESVGNLHTNTGTNWEDALRMANNLEVDPERATFVIFVTDGNPSYRATRGNLYVGDGYPETVNDANLDIRGSDGYYMYRVNSVFGALDENDVRNYNTATMVGKSIVDHNKNLFSIGVGPSSGVTRLQGLTSKAYDNETTGAERTKTAENKDELTQAFNDIAASIVALLGWGDINMTDGITSLSNTVEKSGLLNVDGKFEYWKAPAPEGWSNMTKAQKAEFLETYVPEDSAFSKWNPSTENCNEAVYDESSGSVKWDMGPKFVPESGATYKVTFRVWPSQEAYDILANLKNGTTTYESLKPAQKAQIVDHGDGTYSLKTNDKEPNTTYKAARKTGDGVTTSGEEKTLYFNDVDPMALVPEKMTVKKEWDYSINDSHAADALKFRLKVGGKYYQNDGSFEDSAENAKVLDISEEARTAADGTKIPAWSNFINIAPGIVIFNSDGEAQVYETGHKYQLEEFDVTLEGEDAEQFAGSYEFTTQTVRPMVLTDSTHSAELTYLILADDDNPVPEDATTYTIDGETYYVASGGGANLVGTNHRKAELDITKLIVNNSGKAESELLNDTFTYRVTLDVPADADLSLITGYEYSQRRPNAPNFTLDGYQEDDSPLEGDTERFRGMIFRQGTYKYGSTAIGDAFTDSGNGRKTITMDISLMYDEVLRLTNIPTGTIYTITEIYANYKRANLTSDAQVVPSFDMPGNLADQGYSVTGIRTSATEYEVQGDTITATVSDPNKRYYNQFTNTLGNVADAELKGTKHLEGYTWSDDDRYYFRLEAGTATYTDGSDPGTSPMPGNLGRNVLSLSKSSQPADGDDKTYTFGSIRYTKAGTYTYTIKEVASADVDAETLSGTTGDNGIIYGDAETVTVTVDTRFNGKLYVKSIISSINGVENDHTTMTPPTGSSTAIGNTTITNIRYGEELPSTGGIGTTGLYIAGTLMIFVSAALAIRRRRVV